MSSKPIVYDKLKTPFPADDIEWRVQQSGVKDGKPWAKVLAYVNARAIQDRLDDVCGVDGWSVQYTPIPNGFLAGITIGGITKWDGAAYTDIESVKGGISSALKRAASGWGIGRYLYDVKGDWAVFAPKGRFNSKIEGKYHNWNPPELPEWALPELPIMAYKFAIDSLKNKKEAEAWKEKHRGDLDKLPDTVKGELRKYFTTKMEGLK